MSDPLTMTGTIHNLRGSGYYAEVHRSRLAELFGDRPLRIDPSKVNLRRADPERSLIASGIHPWVLIPDPDDPTKLLVGLADNQQATIVRGFGYGNATTHASVLEPLAVALNGPVQVGQVIVVIGGKYHGQAKEVRSRSIGTDGRIQVSIGEGADSWASGWVEAAWTVRDGDDCLLQPAVDGPVIEPSTQTDWQAMYEAQKTQYEAQKTRYEDLKATHDALWQALADEADRRQWCDEYEDFAEANGGPGREWDWDVEVVMTTEIDESDADSLFGSILNSQGMHVDVTDTVVVRHRASLSVTCTQNLSKEINGTASVVGERLNELGWDFTEYEIIAAERDRLA